MDLVEKGYRKKIKEILYRTEKYNSDETIDFFEPNFINYLQKSYYDGRLPTFYRSNIRDYFDFSGIFNNCESGLNNTQYVLLELFINLNISNVSVALENIPYEVKTNALKKILENLVQKGKLAGKFENIVNCLKEEEKYEFIISIIDKLDDYTIVNEIGILYSEGNDYLCKELLENERIKKICIDLVAPPFFYDMITNLKLSSDFLQMRKETELEILMQPDLYDISVVKEAFCDLCFKDRYQNVVLDIKTILETAQYDVEFKNQYLEETYDLLKGWYSLLTKNDEYFKSNYKKNLIVQNCDILAKCYSMCRKHFKNELSKEINKNYTKNLNPNMLLSTSGKEVECFYIANQTEQQKELSFLVSCIGNLSDEPKIFKELYYSDKSSENRKGFRSFSLLNEKNLDNTFSKKAITFGYKDLRSKTVLHAYPADDGTDKLTSKPFRRTVKSHKSYFWPCNDFINKTYGHSEITISNDLNNNAIAPEFIYTTNQPSQKEIDIAAEFGIPIIYVDKNKYEQKGKTEYFSREKDRYYYNRFCRTKLERTMVEVKNNAQSR